MNFRREKVFRKEPLDGTEFVPVLLWLVAEHQLRLPAHETLDATQVLAQKAKEQPHLTKCMGHFCICPHQDGQVESESRAGLLRYSRRNSETPFQ